jgi:hypothetical protein
MVDASYDANFPRFGELQEGEFFRIKDGEHAGSSAQKTRQTVAMGAASNAIVYGLDGRVSVYIDGRIRVMQM